VLGVLIPSLYATSPLPRISENQLGLLITIILSGDSLSNQRPLNLSVKGHCDVTLLWRVWHPQSPSKINNQNTHGMGWVIDIHIVMAHLLH